METITAHGHHRAEPQHRDTFRARASCRRRATGAYHTTGRMLAVGPRAPYPSGGDGGVVGVAIAGRQDCTRGPTPVGPRLAKYGGAGGRQRGER